MDEADEASPEEFTEAGAGWRLGGIGFCTTILELLPLQSSFLLPLKQPGRIFVN